MCYFFSVRFNTNLSLAVMISSAAFCFAPNPAEALVTQVTVSGLTYDVTSFVGVYNANQTKFQTLANNGVMPWWGSESLATEFATSVGSALGLPYNGNGGPSFAYKLEPTIFGTTYVNGQLYYQNVGILPVGATTNESFTYATATLVPGPLPLFGAGAAFGVSRRLRHRIKLGS